MAHTDRVIILVDLDCFYCQVEEKLNPNLKGKPVAVVQYNAWKGGGIIAVNYQARESGVTRHMRGDEAKQKCPSIELARVPTVRGKADLTKYHDAGKSVAKVLQTFTPLLERASVDEAFLDITEVVKKKLQCATKEIALSELKNTHVVNCDTMDFLYNLYNSGLYEESNMKLAFGGVIAEEIRAAVFQQTGYTCSAGIAHNKILAKLACGFHKPNMQTILPQDRVGELYTNLPVRKIPSLGGKFGNNVSEDLGITNMAELVQFSEKELAKRYDEKNASFLYNIARGIDNNPVTIRLISKSIGCCKKFPGKSALIEVNSVKHWLSELALEIMERLDEDFEENNRRAKQIVINYSQEVNGKDVASSRSFGLNSYDSKKLVVDAYEIIKKNCLNASGTFCVKFLGFSAGKFEECRNVKEITSFFKTDNSSIANASRANNENTTKIDSSFVKQYEENCNSEELQFENTNNAANFSDSTEELNENSLELIFLNENSNENKSDGDSISNELCCNDSDNSNENQHQKKSFFLNYFENMKKEHHSPVLRDFNTSRNLEELEENLNSDENHSDEDLFPKQTPTSNPLPSATSVDMYNIPGTSRDVFQFEEITEACSECHKKIPKFDMVSHMDYHFAIKMVREESKLYKNDTKSTLQLPKQTKKDVKKSGKRKMVETEKNRTLHKFFKKDIEQMEYSNHKTELCPQCNKRIDVEYFVSHLDYHAAKKLHSEINPVKSCAAESLTNKNTSKKIRQTKDIKNNIAVGVTSVTNFFKPTN